MKTTMLITLWLFWGLTLPNDSAIEGKWKMPENDTEIEIKEDGDVYVGTVIKSNVEKAIGKEVLQDLKKEEDVWKGTFYVVRRDRYVDVTLKEIDDKTLEMEIKAGPKKKKLNLTRVE